MIFLPSSRSCVFPATATTLNASLCIPMGVVAGHVNVTIRGPRTSCTVSPRGLPVLQNLGCLDLPSHNLQTRFPRGSACMGLKTCPASLPMNTCHLPIGFPPKHTCFTAPTGVYGQSVLSGWWTWSVNPSSWPVPPHPEPWSRGDATSPFLFPLLLWPSEPGPLRAARNPPHHRKIILRTPQNGHIGEPRPLIQLCLQSAYCGCQTVSPTLSPLTHDGTSRLCDLASVLVSIWPLAPTVGHIPKRNVNIHRSKTC